MSDRVSGCLGDWAHNLLIKRSKTFQFCRIKIRFNRSSLPELNNSKYDRHNVTVERKRKRTSKKKEYIACRVRIVVTYSPTSINYYLKAEHKVYYTVSRKKEPLC